MNKVNKLFADFKKNDLLEDRREYDEEELRTTYNLNKKDAKLLSLKIKKWSMSKNKEAKDKKDNKPIKLKPFNSIRVLKTK